MGRVRPGGDHGRRTLGRAVQAIPPKDGRRLSPCRRGRQGRGATTLRCRGRPAEAAESPGPVEGAHRMGSKDGGGCGGDGGDGGQQGRTGFPPHLRQGERSGREGLAAGAQVLRESRQEGGRRESQERQDNSEERRQAKALSRARGMSHTEGSRSTASATLRIQSLLQVIWTVLRARSISSSESAASSVTSRVRAARCGGLPIPAGTRNHAHRARGHHRRPEARRAVRAPHQVGDTLVAAQDVRGGRAAVRGSARGAVAVSTAAVAAQRLDPGLAPARTPGLRRDLASGPEDRYLPGTRHPHRRQDAHLERSRAPHRSSRRSCDVNERLLAFALLRNSLSGSRPSRRTVSWSGNPVRAMPWSDWTLRMALAVASSISPRFAARRSRYPRAASPSWIRSTAPGTSNPPGDAASGGRPGISGAQRRSGWTRSVSWRPRPEGVRALGAAVPFFDIARGSSCSIAVSPFANALRSSLHVAGQVSALGSLMSPRSGTTPAAALRPPARPAGRWPASTSQALSLGASPGLAGATSTSLSTGFTPPEIRPSSTWISANRSRVPFRGAYSVSLATRLATSRTSRCSMEARAQSVMRRENGSAVMKIDSC